MRGLSRDGDQDVGSVPKWCSRGWRQRAVRPAAPRSCHGAAGSFLERKRRGGAAINERQREGAAGRCSGPHRHILPRSKQATEGNPYPRGAGQPPCFRGRLTKAGPGTSQRGQGPARGGCLVDTCLSVCHALSTLSGQGIRSNSCHLARGVLWKLSIWSFKASPSGPELCPSPSPPFTPGHPPALLCPQCLPAQSAAAGIWAAPQTLPPGPAWEGGAQPSRGEREIPRKGRGQPPKAAVNHSALAVLLVCVAQASSSPGSHQSTP